jgi:hypothetical protein
VATLGKGYKLLTRIRREIVLSLLLYIGEAIERLDLLPPSRMLKSEVEILPAPSLALIGQNSETKLDY